MHTIKPIDKEMIIKCAKETKRLISIEDHSIIGGLGSIIADVLCENYPATLTKMGVKDRFGESGKAQELMTKFEIDCDAIVREIEKKG